MFPTQDTSLATTATTGKTLNFDFNAGDFVVQDGKIVTLTGLDALKMWIQKALKTEKDKYPIYINNTLSNNPISSGDTPSYGVTLLDLTTSGFPVSFIKAQIQTNITNTLLTNSNITAVSNFVFSGDIKRTLTVNFTVSSVYGATNEGVTI